MKKLVILLALAASPAFSQEAKPGAPVITGPQSSPFGAEFNISKVPKGVGVLWDVSPQPAGLVVRVVKVEKAVIIYGPAGDYSLRVRLIEVNKDGEVDTTELPSMKFQITGGGGPTPVDPVDPPVDPVVPPSDPYVKALREAAQASGWSPGQLKGVAIVLRASSEKTQVGMTVIAIMKAHNEEWKAAFPNGVPDRIRDLIGQKLKALDTQLPPAQPNKVPTMNQIALVKSILGTTATAVEEAVK